MGLHLTSSQMSHLGVDQNYDTPHTSLSVWALLDEGALFYASSPLLSDELERFIYPVVVGDRPLCLT